MRSVEGLVMKGIYEPAAPVRAMFKNELLLVMSIIAAIVAIMPKIGFLSNT
jgi:hypothetical protein